MEYLTAQAHCITLGKPLDFSRPCSINGTSQNETFIARSSWKDLVIWCIHSNKGPRSWPAPQQGAFSLQGALFLTQSSLPGLSLPVLLPISSAVCSQELWPPTKVGCVSPSIWISWAWERRNIEWSLSPIIMMANFHCSPNWIKTHNEAWSTERVLLRRETLSQRNQTPHSQKERNTMRHIFGCLCGGVSRETLNLSE